ncbi:MAG: hypothetical protein HZB46_12175 [Solirubrobacterales bacterium]|nr:hypothetical protein [Solirubrobacterales bacterium]
MDAGALRDLWIAVSPDTTKLTSIVREGDARLRAAQGQLSPQDYGAAVGTIVRALVDRYPQTAPPATFRVLVSPLVLWIWVGGLLVAGGGLICLWPAPDMARRRATAGYAARVAQDLGRA